MLRKANRLRKAFGERIVALAMLPVLLVGTSPHVICVCASGQRMPYCPMLAKHQPRPTEVAATNCCQKHRPEQASPCCRAPSGEAAQQCHIPAGKIESKSSGCCRAVVEAAAPTIAQKPITADSTPAAAPLPTLYLVAAELWPAVASVEYATPPPDLVILLSRLTI